MFSEIDENLVLIKTKIGLLFDVRVFMIYHGEYWTQYLKKNIRLGLNLLSVGYGREIIRSACY